MDLAMWSIIQGYFIAYYGVFVWSAVVIGLFGAVMEGYADTVSRETLEKKT